MNGASHDHTAQVATVSVVIPSLDRPRGVAAAVASVLAQGVECEVIVVDDGSEPPIEPLGSLAHPAVTILRNETCEGPTKARNRGLAAAGGRYVAFLDDDDVWLPGKLRRCLEVIDALPGAGVVAHRTAFHVSEARTSGPRPVTVVAEPLRLYGRSQTPHLDSLMVDATLAKEVLFDERFDAGEDVDFILELARRSPFALLDEVYAVHGHDAAPTKIGMQRRIAGRIRLLEKHADVLAADASARAFHLVRLGLLYRRAGQRRLAARCFLRAIRSDPAAALAWKALATTLLPVSVSTSLSVARRIRRRTPETAGEGRRGPQRSEARDAEESAR